MRSTASPGVTRASSTRGRTRLLLTGFGPFPGVPSNATMRLVPALAEALPAHLPDISCTTLLLATAWASAPQRVADVVADAAPDLILHFGVSSRARGFEIETRARNVCLQAADAEGLLPAAELLDAQGQAFLPANLPVRHILARLRAQRIPAFASRDAGSYLCNCVLYHSLANPVARENARIGFIHVPASLARASVGSKARRGACPLSWEQALRGGLEIIAAALGRPAPLYRP